MTTRTQQDGSSIDRQVEQLVLSIAPTTTIERMIMGDDAEAVQLLNTTANQLGKKLAECKVTTSQIRIVFSAARMIEQEVKMAADTTTIPVSAVRSLMMLRPKLAYQYGRISDRDRGKKLGMGLLHAVLSTAIPLINTNAQFFNNFMDLFEAILAYHRYHGGSTN